MTVIWPNPWELQLYRDKISLIANLNNVAHNITHTSQPIMVVITKDTPIPNVIVIKHSYSDVSDHVIMPKDCGRQSWRYLVKNTNTPWTTWFYQPYICHLVKLGEFCVYFVDMEPQYTVWTCKHTDPEEVMSPWEFELVEDFYLLSALRYVLITHGVHSSL